MIEKSSTKSKIIKETSQNSLEEFKTSFGRNYELASRKFSTAIEQIDKSITN